MPVSGTAVTVEGHAIVSTDGMIAAADGSMPPELRSDADWRLFQASLDRAVLVVLGRHGHARHANPGRRRLVLTTSVANLEPDPADRLATFWNPAGIDIAPALSTLGVVQGTIAITGGTGTFDLFLPHYDRFVLSEVRNSMLSDGIPCFSNGHPRFVLPGAGLGPADMEMIDRNVVQTQWLRSARVLPGTC